MSVLPKITSNLLYFKEKAIGLMFQFIVENRFGEFLLTIDVSLSPGRTKYRVVEEEVSVPGKQGKYIFKSLISKHENGILIGNKKIQEMNESDRVSVMVANRMAVE